MVVWNLCINFRCVLGVWFWLVPLQRVLFHKPNAIGCKWGYWGKFWCAQMAGVLVPCITQKLLPEWQLAWRLLLNYDFQLDSGWLFFVIFCIPINSNCLLKWAGILQEMQKIIHMGITSKTKLHLFCQLNSTFFFGIYSV